MRSLASDPFDDGEQRGVEVVPLLGREVGRERVERLQAGRGARAPTTSRPCVGERDQPRAPVLGGFAARDESRWMSPSTAREAAGSDRPRWAAISLTECSPPSSSRNSIFTWVNELPSSVTTWNSAADERRFRCAHRGARASDSSCGGRNLCLHACKYCTGRLRLRWSWPDLPAGDPAPADGALPSSALDGVGTRPFGFYVHVPFCASRCGYCDFNTYVPGEQGAEQACGYLGSVLAEIDLAARCSAACAGVDTVFFGGGTPTLLSADSLIADPAADRGALRAGGRGRGDDRGQPGVGRSGVVVGAARGRLQPDLAGDAERGPRVLATLDRVHSPGRPEAAVAEARAAGFEQVSLDLIYGTPGETADDWRARSTPR